MGMPWPHEHSRGSKQLAAAVMTPAKYSPDLECDVRDFFVFELVVNLLRIAIVVVVFVHDQSLFYRVRGDDSLEYQKVLQLR